MSDAAHTTSVVELHRRLVAIPSLSGEEGELADFLEGWLRSEAGAAGLEIRRVGDNILASIGDGPDTLMLNTHLDVVPPSDDHPQGAFDAAVQEGAVWGRGSVDAKASLAAMSQAVVEAARSGRRIPGGRLLAAFTVCEETGGDDNGLQEVLRHIQRPDAAVVGEPTMLQPCIAQKGLLILRLVAHGRSAHAGRPELADNAIERAAEDVLRVRDLTFDRIHPQLGATKCSATVIRGGEARNVIPDTCTVTLDIRSTPAYTHEELIGIVDEAVESEIVVHSKRLVPVETAPDARIARAAQEAARAKGAPAEFFGSPTLSDWVFLAGIPTVKIGPGDSRLSHTAEEHVPIGQLDRGAAVYSSIIRNYFADTGNE
jgi:acetylornithine deacetylase